MWLLSRSENVCVEITEEDETPQQLEEEVEEILEEEEDGGRPAEEGRTLFFGHLTLQSCSEKPDKYTCVTKYVRICFTFSLFVFRYILLYCSRWFQSFNVVSLLKTVFFSEFVETASIAAPRKSTAAVMALLKTTPGAVEVILLNVLCIDFIVNYIPWKFYRTLYP